MAVAVLKQKSYLIATLHQGITDAEFSQLRLDLLNRIGEVASTGVILDVSALDVLDSFATRTLRDVALATRLRGAETVIVGIQPEVAFAMVQLGLSLRFEEVTTTLDLEEGLAWLDAHVKRARSHGR